jgi:hypothetical protein
MLFEFQQDRMMLQLKKKENLNTHAMHVKIENPYSSMMLNFEFRQDKDKKAYDFKGMLHMFRQKENVLNFKGMFYIRQEEAVDFKGKLHMIEFRQEKHVVNFKSQQEKEGDALI